MPGMHVNTSFNLMKQGLRPWRDGWLLPERFSGTVDDKACPYLVELELALQDGQVECTAARFVQRKDGPPVTPRPIRSVRLAAYVRAVVAQAAWPVKEIVESRSKDGRPFQTVVGDSFSDENYGRLLTELGEEARTGGRRRMGEQHLRAVAEVYLAAKRSGRPARQAVQADERWKPVPASTAARWIKAARDAGLLEEKE